MDNKERGLRRFSPSEGRISFRYDGESVVLRPISQPSFKVFEALCPMSGEYDYACERDVVYAQAKGYWSSYPRESESLGDIYLGRSGMLSSQEDLSLAMDIYTPVSQADTILSRPLVVLFHGGGFYCGDKGDASMVKLAEAYAQRGCVVASVDYRMGFRPLGTDFERAQYRALQDGDASLRFLLGNASKYHINKDLVFVVGPGAGGMTALGLAFMRGENRPESTKSLSMDEVLKDEEGEEERVDFFSMLGRGFQNLFGGRRRLREQGFRAMLWDEDLGAVSSLSPSEGEEYSIRGVVSIAGAIGSLELLANAPGMSVLSFHGTDDTLVPFEQGFPFGGVDADDLRRILASEPWLGSFFENWRNPLAPGTRPLNEQTFPIIYGSGSIHENRELYGISSQLHVFDGQGHNPHLNEDGTISQQFYAIRDTISDYILRRSVAAEVRLESVPAEEGTFEVKGDASVGEIYWKVQGGIMLSFEQGKARVMFFGDEFEHSIRLCGCYKDGTGFDYVKLF